jgi:cell division protein FtsL
MSVVAEAPIGKVRRPKTDHVRSRAPFAGGVAWIVFIGVLLAGIVAVNVLVLQLNMQFDGLGRQRAQLRADNALLRSQLSSASANVRIQDAATAKLGLRAADPLTTTYVRLGAK